MANPFLFLRGVETTCASAVSLSDWLGRWQINLELPIFVVTLETGIDQC
jgi:hypothetical protein